MHYISIRVREHIPLEKEQRPDMQPELSTTASVTELQSGQNMKLLLCSIC